MKLAKFGDLAMMNGQVLELFHGLKEKPFFRQNIFRASILRFSRAVLLSNFEAMVFGGNENQMFTKFTFNEGFSSIESEYLAKLPSLNYWGDPFAILVSDHYCVFS